tara:strand:- start:126 stop:866 length:741 start_codon:yes stop_codon:yes gene_type:complete
MKLNNKVAVITGGAGGIGLATARKFASEGAKIILWDIDSENLERAAKEISQITFTKYNVVNVTNLEEVQSQFEEIVHKMGSVDIMIANAGITRDAMLHKMNEDQWDQVIEVNLKGVFNCGQTAARLMREQGNGVILSTSSVVGLDGNIGQTNYAAAKAGVIAMTKTWAKELGSKGIRVNAVAPGFTATEMIDTIPQKVIDLVVQKTPLARIGQPEEIAAAFCFLASDEASFITGQVLCVDGGMTLT